MSKVRVTMQVNGRPFEAYVTPNQPLSEVLRTEAGATEVKYGCGEGVCGTCTVLLDSEPVNSCLIFAVQAEGASIQTVRSLANADGGLGPLQRSFLENGASQCGFCTPGMLLTAHWFLKQNPYPDRDQIRAAISGNLCRCTGYVKIVDAIGIYAEQRASNVD